MTALVSNEVEPARDMRCSTSLSRIHLSLSLEVCV